MWVGQKHTSSSFVVSVLVIGRSDFVHLTGREVRSANYSFHHVVDTSGIFGKIGTVTSSTVENS